MVDLVLGRAAKAAAIEALRGYNQVNNQRNLDAYQESLSPMSRHSVYRTNTGLTPSQRQAAAKESAEIGRQAGEIVAKAMERAKTAPKVAELRKAAADWRQRALDGRVAGMDVGVRELLVRKAEAAEAEADRLESGDVPNASPVDEERARAFDAEAARCEGKALDMSLTPSLREYYRDRAREHRNSAAALRGEKIPNEADQPVNREVRIVL
jgi:hypothetical protein